MKKLIVMILLLVAIPLSLQATTREIVKIKEGKSKGIRIKQSTRTLKVYTIVKGHNSVPLKVSATVPRGTKIKAKASKIKSLRQFKKKNFYKKLKKYKLSLIKESEQDEESVSCVPYSIHEETSESDLPVDEDDERNDLGQGEYSQDDYAVCDLLNQDYLEIFRLALGNLFLYTVTRKRACEAFLDVFKTVEGYVDIDHLLIGLISGIGGTVIGLSGQQTSFDTLSLTSIDLDSPQNSNKTERQVYSGILHKDSCTPFENLYVVELNIRLRKRRQKRKLTSLVTVKIEQGQETQRKEMALKPISEGRYSPRPIWISNWLGNACGMNMAVTNWNNGKMVGRTEVDVYTLLPWRGMTLALGLADSTLTRGEGTLELVNSEKGHGGCFSLERRRQNINGYPEIN